MVYNPEYFAIIGNRLLNPLENGEVHHIFPKSLGGSNKKDNLVKLTTDEHFRCHELLVEMMSDDPKAHQKMACAWHFLSHTRDGLEITAEEYSKIREEHRRAVSEMLKGHEVKPESRKKLSEARKGHKDSDETRRKKSEGHKGLVGPWKERKHTKEYCEKMSASLKGRPCPNKGKLWYHDATRSYLCFPSDPKIEELNLVVGRLR